MLDAVAWMATFRTRRSAVYRDASSVMIDFPVRLATAHASAPSPAAKSDPQPAYGLPSP